MAATGLLMEVEVEVAADQEEEVAAVEAAVGPLEATNTPDRGGHQMRNGGIWVMSAPELGRCQRATSLPRTTDHTVSFQRCVLWLVLMQF